ncbi:MAG: sugar ABC transporter substrate-binding protein [Geodermatophilaceae bacterium]|nr:sugar ABC transporter substrate-binding protein [Geodermatophilaceae bacterium]
MNSLSPRTYRSAWRAAVAVIGLAVVTSCTSPSAPEDEGSADSTEGGSDSGSAAASGDISIAVITHGGDGDAFWSVAQNGAEQAGEDLGVEVNYTSDGDAAAQARLIDNAVAQGVSGMVVSMANPDALQGSIEAAVEAGIPVITINSGEAESIEFGALAHVGQSEEVAGEGAGERFTEEGATKLLCVIPEAGNIGLTQRCEGAASSFGDVTELQVDLNNPTDVQARIRGALQADPEIDGVLALNPQVATAAVSAAGEAGSEAQVATFDLSADVIAGIEAGDILFAVDQQQYLQGYLPVVMIKLFIENANTIGGGLPVLTGPGFVDESNAADVAEYAERGTR